MDMFTLDVLSGGRPMVGIGLMAVKAFDLQTKLRLDPLVLAKFFKSVEDGYGRYPTVPYHNNLHGADVLHGARLRKEAMLER
jgi:hypothetical protein